MAYRKFDKAIELFEEVLTFDCIRNRRELFESVQGHLKSAKSF